MKPLKSIKVNVSYVQLESKDLTESEMNNLEDAVAKRQLDRIEKILEEKNQVWEETGPFDLKRTTLPKLAEKGRLFRLVLDQLPRLGLVAKTLRLRDKIYVMKIEDFQGGEYVTSLQNTGAVDKAKPDSGNMFGLPTDEILAKILLSNKIFQSWFKQVRGEANIKINFNLSD